MHRATGSFGGGPPLVRNIRFRLRTRYGASYWLTIGSTHTPHASLLSYAVSNR